VCTYRLKPVIAAVLYVVIWLVCSQRFALADEKSRSRPTDTSSACKLWTDADHASWIATWSGPCVNGFASGHGVAQWSNNGVPADRYEGDFSEGAPHGEGVLTHSDGGGYSGEWKAGRKSGKGRMTNVIGDHYFGEFEDDEAGGVGIFQLAIGANYVGEFKDGRPNGLGVLSFPHGEKYAGEFAAGRPDGQGIFVDAAGEKYIGMFKNGQPTEQPDSAPILDTAIEVR